MLLVVFGVALGASLFSLLLILPLPIPITSPVYRYLGIQKPRIIGFLPYFLSYRATNNYNPYINVLTYFSVTIDEHGHVITLAAPNQEEPDWHDLHTKDIQQKLASAKNNGAILSLAITGQSEATISALIKNPQQSAKNLLQDLAPLISTYGFSDINIDLESFVKATTQDQTQFTAFIKTLSRALHKQNITVTVDIAPIAFIHPTVIDPLRVAQVSDFVLLMTYDFSTVLSGNTGPIAPLGGMGIENEFDVTKAVAIAKQEIDPAKIILGIPLYGYEWDSLSNVPHAATIPNTGQAASNRRMLQTFNTSCTTCITAKDPLAKETIFIFQDKAGDPYYHQVFLFTQQDFSDRITFTVKNNLAGVGLWALGYEGNTLLQPLNLYKSSFSL